MKPNEARKRQSELKKPIFQDDKNAQSGGFLKYFFGSGVKNLPAKQEMRVQSLDQEEPLKKEMTTHFCILAWEIPWTEPGRLQSMGSQE